MPMTGRVGWMIHNRPSIGASLIVRVVASTFPGKDPVREPPWMHLLRRPRARCRLRRPPGLKRALHDALRLTGFNSLKGPPTLDRIVLAAADEGALPVGSVIDDLRRCAVLQCGLPISLLDRAAVQGHLGFGVGRAGEASDGGSVKGLPCVRDETGAIATPLGEPDRVRPRDTAKRTLSIVWGVGDPVHVRRATAWYSELVERLGAVTEVFQS